MKILIITLMIITEVSAGTISFIGPCSKEPIFERSFSLEKKSNVGKLTIEILEAEGIPYLGTELGINSIFNTATGQEAIEIISDQEMLAYGWCYKVNDFEPGDYPNQVLIEEADNLTWWFGYAHYKNGEWIAQCNPSYLRKSPVFCEEDKER